VPLDSERITRYLLSLPERTFRSASAIAAGLVREVGHATLPAAVRRSRVYDAMVESMLRFLIERVGEVEGVYPGEQQLASDFLLRRTAGGGIEWLIFLTFHASPVWVMAALADLTGGGRQLVREISDALKREGLLDPNEQFETVDQMLDGLEKTSAQLAETINTPPLDVAALRSEWETVQANLKSIPPRSLPSPERLTAAWRELESEAKVQGRSVVELSAAIALSAITRLPESLVWLSRCTQTAAVRTSQVFADTLLRHYTDIVAEIRNKGFLSYWAEEMRPYLRGAARQFSPQRLSATERLLAQRRR
jgi:hypothetical protein